MWTENRTLTFSEADLSSSGVQTAQNRADFQAASLQVQALDIDAWLLATVRQEDDVTVKVDIELAEIPVFARLVQTGCGML